LLVVEMTYVRLLPVFLTQPLLLDKLRYGSHTVNGCELVTLGVNLRAGLITFRVILYHEPSFRKLSECHLAKRARLDAY